MAGKRTYGDSCGIARALDVVGERWALLVVRELVLGPKRFTDLREGLPRLGPDMLAQRLRDLEEAGVVRRRTLPAPAASRVYELTDWGADLEPVLLELGRWGSRVRLPDQPPSLGVDAAILALETTFDPAGAVGLNESYEIRLGDQRFSLTVTDGRLRVARGGDGDAAVSIETDTTTLAALAFHGRSLHDAIAVGDARVDGDLTAAERLLTLFRDPVPVTV
jgi:DNA-binding HxlR family transcriptional regulator